MYINIIYLYCVCVCFDRWPGSSLIVIRGHKHLHECAYIGDDSSEELDEIYEAIQDGTYVHPNASTNNPPNKPDLMKRHRDDVEFHHEQHKKAHKNYTLPTGLDTSDITDPKDMKKILTTLSTSKKTAKDTQKKSHIHRNSTIAKSEEKNFKFNDTSHSVNRTANVSDSDALINDIVAKLMKLGMSGEEALKKIHEQFKLKANNSGIDHGRQYQKPQVKFEDHIERRKREVQVEITRQLNKHDEENNVAAEEVSINFEFSANLF